MNVNTEKEIPDVTGAFGDVSRETKEYTPLPCRSLFANGQVAIEQRPADWRERMQSTTVEPKREKAPCRVGGSH